MTRGRALGRLFAFIFLAAAGALALGPGVAERALSRHIAALGARVDLQVTPLSLGAEITSFELSRGGFEVVCRNGNARLETRSLLGDPSVRTLRFESCTVSESASEDTPPISAQPSAESRTELAAALDSLSGLPDVHRLEIASLDVDAVRVVLTLSDLSGEISGGEVTFDAHGSMRDPIDASFGLVVRATADAVTVAATGHLESRGVAVRDPTIEARRDGSIAWNHVDVVTPIGRVSADSIVRTAEGTVSIVDAHVDLDAAPTPSHARLVFARSRMIHPRRAEFAPEGLARRAISYLPSATAVVDRVRTSLDAVPLRIEAEGTSLDGLPSCDTLTLDDLLLDRATLITSGRCDDTAFSVAITADMMSGSATGVPASRVIPGAVGTLDVQIDPVRVPNGVTADVGLILHGLGIQHDAVSSEPVALDGSVEVSLTMPADQRVGTSALSLTGRLGAVPIDMTLTVEPDGESWTLHAEGGVTEDTGCDAMWQAVPQGLIPSLRNANVSLSGAAAPRLRATYVVGDPDSFDMRREGFIGDCVVESIDLPFDPTTLLADDYIHTVTDHVSAPLQVGPGTWGYATLDELPAYVPALMHLSEEIAFFDNPGFSMMLMRRAVRMNLRESRYVYGGSTVSQQLVKNLFFGREKTLARKFEEAIVVWAMERVVSKERILELYLNCVEFAPDMYGITAAARHYFDKRPGELTPLEAAFLAALKPAPSRGERHRARGHSPDTGWWHERLLVLLQRLVEHGPYIDQDEVDYYSPYIVAFPTSEHAGEVGVEPRPRPKWAIDESFTEARVRLGHGPLGD